MHFGLASAPRAFTKILKPVMESLSRQGICVIIYLDDRLFMHEVPARLLSAVDLTVHLLKSLGFLINWEKSAITPVSDLEFLGLRINSLDMSLALPSDKLEGVIVL